MALRKFLDLFSIARGKTASSEIVPGNDDGEQAAAMLAQARAAYGQERIDDAESLLQRAIGYRHDCAEAHLLLGLIHKKRQRWEEAADCFVLASCFDPALAEAHFQLGILALARNDAMEARKNFEQTLQADPGHVDAHVNLGKLLIDRGDHEAARRHLERALEINPRLAVACSNLGYALFKGFYRADEALQCFAEALRLDPELANAHCNRGMVLQYLGRCEEAVIACDRALQLNPGFSEAHLNRALALLMMGDYASGWREYEVRKKLHLSLQRPFPYPEWEGGPLAGRTILVQAEQGLGDEIMFAACLPELIAQAGRCVVECHPRLERLFARSFPEAVVIGADQADSSLAWLKRAPAIDCRVASGSLPQYFRSSPADFPHHAGYLTADPGRVRYWHERLAALGSGLKVGISWRGGTRHSNQGYRSLALPELLPLLRRQDAHFISLQYTDCAAEIAALRAEHGVTVHHWQEAIDDYDETAALAVALEGVISVQTAAVHLAGALGRPVWAMVPAAPEWRYQRSGDTLPWYPSLRIFRQQTLGEWEPVIGEVASRLDRLAQG